MAAEEGFKLDQRCKQRVRLRRADLRGDQSCLFFRWQSEFIAIALLHPPESGKDRESEVRGLFDAKSCSAREGNQLSEPIAAVMQQVFVINVVEAWAGGHLNMREPAWFKDAVNLRQ